MSGSSIQAPHRPLSKGHYWWVFAVLALATLLLAWNFPPLSHFLLPAEMAASSEQHRIPSLTLTPSCIDPAAGAQAVCEAMAQRILASTVKVMFLGDGPVCTGHGTVVGGRYVITHNHYSTYHSGERAGALARKTHISLSLANGEFILRNAPLSNFTVIASEPGFLLLDFRTVGGQGFFDHLGVPSAPLVTWNAAAIQPGSEVAQVNWDGKTTFVEWVRVSSIRETGSTFALEIDNYIELGASGGGVFSGGYHIANNRLQGSVYQKRTRERVRGYSVATVNDATALSFLVLEEPAD